jgi:trehalose 6-phosphate phosphatase
MPPLFDHLDFMQRFLALSPLGLITDIDGTISQTAPTPVEAQVSPVCLHYLDLLSKCLKLVAVISGRAVSQVRDMIDLEDIVYVGNHGLERWAEGKAQLYSEVSQYPAMIEATLQELKPLLPIEGIFFENKGATASIHYRRCQDHDGTREQILTAIAGSPSTKGLQIKEARRAVELVPPVRVNKGSAIQDLIREYKLRSAIYMGDDLTDLDAFRAIRDYRSQNFDSISLAVLNKETAPEVEEGADFTLDGVDEVERFLEWLAGAIQT